MKHWLFKQEPSTYPFKQLMADGRTEWTGVRNYQARNFLREMRVGDPVLYYHSVEGKEVVGVAVVTREAFPDPTTEPDEHQGKWVAVEITASEPFERPVSLATLKAEPDLCQLPLLKQSRLSVLPVTAAQFQRIVTLSRG